MKILVLYAHPVETSFNAALHRLIVERLTAAGHAVDDCDLYAEDFDPRHDARRAARLSRSAQRRTSRSPPMSSACSPPKRWCSPFPVWNYGYPAILKGFFDRVFLPGVSFRLVDGKVAAVAAQHPQGRGRHHLWRQPVSRLADGRSAAKARQPPAARDGQARRAGLLSGALFDEPLHRADRAKTFMAKVAAKMDAF